MNPERHNPKTNNNGLKPLDCMKCCHFYITHDKSFPYGCRSMGFKSKVIPSVSVVDASDMQCLRFEVKVKKRK
jgi:hypothetical protein